MRSHIGALMTFGQEAILSISTKQTINTKSSTETELVGVDETLPLNIWCHYYLEWQGHRVVRCNPQDGDILETNALGESNIL